MNWLLAAITAQLILGSSAVLDKFLLKKRSVDPWPYAFWLGILGIFAFVLLPFGYQPVPTSVVAFAIFSGALFFGAIYFTVLAIKKSEISEALPLIGTISPVLTLLFSVSFLNIHIGFADFTGFTFLILAGFMVFLAERKELRQELLVVTLAASFFVAASHITTKAVFLQTNFITGFFWIKMGALVSALLLLSRSKLRKKIIRTAGRISTANKILYLSNRAYAALGSLLASFAVFLSNPALVDATQNIRYAVIFILAWLFLRERFRGQVLLKKILAAFFIAVGLIWLAVGEYTRTLPPVPTSRKIEWGVTFSPKFSRELGLPWQDNFRAILDDLRAKRLRLIAYWSDIEREKGHFDFSDLDWQFFEAGQRRAEIVLVVGLKTPRWPECHEPAWTADLTTEKREEALRNYIAKVIERYRSHPAVVMWQVENEPYLLFGECRNRGNNFLEREIEVVRKNDPAHPILVTDGGEFGLWAPVAKHADVFGTTMYRKVYPRFVGPVFGVIEYPLTPKYFRVKERFVKWINGTPDQKFIASELQGEPWSPRSLKETPYQWQVESFSPEYFVDTIKYAKEAGFDEYYLWGAEWWYYMKEKYHDSHYWEIARSIFRDRE